MSVKRPESSSHDNRILSHITGTFSSGTVTLVLGPSGAGKSTLLRTLSGIAPPSTGSITIDGSPLYKGNKVLRRALMKVGYVGQFAEDGLFRPTVQSELAYSMRPYPLEREVQAQRIQQGLRQANIPRVNWNDSPLLFSSGQKRRIATASTLATDATWLLFDEPTAGLDASSRQTFVRLLAEQQTMRQGVVISTHDLNTLLPIADTVWILSEGRLIGVHNPDELLQAPDILTQAHLGVPDIIRMNRLIRSSGIPRLISDPKRMANDLLEAAHLPYGADCPHIATLPETQDIKEPPLVSEEPARLAMRLHPTSRLAFFGLVAVSLFVNDSWLSLCANAAMLQATSLLYRARMWNLLKSVRGILWMVGLSAALAATRFGGPTGMSIHWSGAVPALRGGGTFAMAVMMGALVPYSLSRRELQASIEGIFAPLSLVRFPVQALSLAAMLIIRFLPMLSNETRRFAEISTVRGKFGGHPRRLRAKQLPAMLTPLLLSILRLGEEVATALEARGLRGFTAKTVRRIPFTWNKNDWSLVCAALLFLLGVCAL